MDNRMTTSPTLIVDSREQCPLRFAHLPVEVAGLTTGDYSVKGLEHDFSVERKSISDLIGSVTSGRDRFMRELQRIKAHGFRRLVVIGTPADIAGQCRGANPRSVLASVAAIDARFCPVVWMPTAEAAALQVQRWAFWTWRESLKVAGVKLETPAWAVAAP